MPDLLRERRPRLPVQGRIRIGILPVPNRPQGIETFRFTSWDEEALHQVAAVYGGEVRPWSNQHEVITNADAISVVLPPDPMGEGPSYQLWNKGGCLRRCDGEVCTVAGEEDYEQVPCICDGKGVLECTYSARLDVILTDINFNGVWSYYTKSKKTGDNLQSMSEIVQLGQQAGLVKAKLFNRPRKTKNKKGQVVHVREVQLGLDAPLDELQQGEPRLALPKAQDEDIVDAIVVNVLDLTDVQLGALALRASGGLESDPQLLKGDEQDRFNRALAALEDGEVYFAGVRPDGSADLQPTAKEAT